MLYAAVAAQLGISVVDQGIPTLTGFIKADLHLSAAAVGLVVSAFAFGKIFGSYGAGLAADRFGERRVLIAGGLGTATLVATAAALPLAGFFPLLVLAGSAGAASTPAGGRLVLQSFDRTRRGLALGIRQTGIPVGGLIAAALLPWIAHRSSWRWGLAVAAGLTMLSVIPLARLGRRERPAPAPPPETARTAPRFRPSHDRNLWLLTAWGCLVVSGQYALVAFLALDFHRSAGLSLVTASSLLAVANLSGAFGRVGWGALSDRALSRGRKPLLLVLTAAGLLGALLLLVTPRSAPLGVLFAISAVAGLGVIGFQGLWVTMVAETAGPERVGAATGFAITFVTAAIALSPPLYGLVADAAGTYRAIWAVLAGVLTLAFVPALLIREP